MKTSRLLSEKLHLNQNLDSVIHASMNLLPCMCSGSHTSVALLISDLRAAAGCSPLLLFCDDSPQNGLVTHYLHFISLVVIQQLERI